MFCRAGLLTAWHSPAHKVLIGSIVSPTEKRGTCYKAIPFMVQVVGGGNTTNKEIYAKSCLQMTINLLLARCYLGHRRRDEEVPLSIRLSQVCKVYASSQTLRHHLPAVISPCFTFHCKITHSCCHWFPFERSAETEVTFEIIWCLSHAEGSKVCLTVCRRKTAADHVLAPLQFIWRAVQHNFPFCTKWWSFFQETERVSMLHLKVFAGWSGALNGLFCCKWLA